MPLALNQPKMLSGWNQKVCIVDEGIYWLLAWAITIPAERANLTLSGI
jgi:hypothetical protein